MLNGELPFSDEDERLVVESCKGEVGNSDSNENVDDGKQKHGQRCILTCRHAIPEDQKAVPKNGKKGDENVRQREPSVGEEKTSGSLLHRNVFRDGSFDHRLVVEHGLPSVFRDGGNGRW